MPLQQHKFQFEKEVAVNPYLLRLTQQGHDAKQGERA